MAKDNEKVRLLLVGDEEEDKPQKSNRRPVYAKNCCLLSVLQICCFFLLLIILAFITTQVIKIERDITPKAPKDKEKDKKSSKTFSLESTIPGSDFCKSVNAENLSMVALGYLTGMKEEQDKMETKNKIYYITNRLLTDQEACAVEAHLRLFQDKSIFVIEVGEFNKTSSKVDYVSFLQEQYTNLNTLKSTYEKFFKGSPFQNKLTHVNNEFSIFAAKVLLVWQFGGTVLSPDFLMTSRRPLDNNEGSCEVDRDMLFCPNQCSAYVYQLVKTLLDSLGNRNQSSTLTENEQENIVNKSVTDYCGDRLAATIGCVGVNRIKYYRICQTPGPDCHFMRVQQWKLNDLNWKVHVQKLCPKIVTKFLPSLSSDKNNKETHYCNK